MKSSKILGLFIIALLIVIGILLFIILSNEPKSIEKFDDKPYRDSILVLEKEISLLKEQNDSLGMQNFFLQNARDKVKIIYREKQRFIRGATVPELDSIIRANW